MITGKQRSYLRSFATTSSPGLKQGDQFIFEEEVSTLDTLLIFTRFFLRRTGILKLFFY